MYLVVSHQLTHNQAMFSFFFTVHIIFAPDCWVDPMDTPCTLLGFIYHLSLQCHSSAPITVAATRCLQNGWFINVHVRDQTKWIHKTQTQCMSHDIDVAS